ncbi:MAG: putative hydro-lyase [SAR324 cluster bacterium]|nr:putative hydro-lyase [SAR324 cluster bacterium]MCZ6627618.1 putative hydro-lyase [SAR324 cluster bacterium]MCZ6843097.1 putative hydro-lyase [SAR324 cluster bacterium]
MSEELASRALREEIRSCRFENVTSGQAMGFVQANLVVVPQAYAFDFLLFCQRNPKPCPLLEVVEAGSVEPRRMAPGADIRTDLPRYRVFRDGVMTEEKTTVQDIWQDDFVSFLLGCSFSFEKPLLDSGLEVRNLTDGVNVPMYRLNIACRPSGPFEGPLVVSMRPFTPEDAIKAALITGAMPEVHGAPIHMGNPAAIGISDIDKPDYGVPANIREGEVPVFWACGVTPQEILLNAKLPLAITHAPGHMFVTDLREEKLKMFRETVR